MAYKQKLTKRKYPRVKNWMEKYFTQESKREEFRKMWLKERKEHPSLPFSAINTIVWDHLYKKEQK
jgi:mitochondrial fission protein ELM1